MEKFDIVVIGSGPAGITAAATAATHGATVTLLDEQASAGGQIYRNRSRCSAERAARLGKDYVYGAQVIAQLDNENIKYVNGATVWSINEQGVLAYSKNCKATQIKAQVVIIATGALERAYPIPGWTLPGVMTAGAAQILLKTSGIALEKPVLAGSGPLLYAVASQLLAAGSELCAIVDTVTPGNYLRAAPLLPLSSVGTIASGLSYLWKIKKAGVPHYRNCSSIEVIGSRNAEGIRFQHKDKEIELNTRSVLLHQGVIPNAQLSRSVGIDHQWNKRQRCFQPVTDDWGATSIPCIRIAGDSSGTGGAVNAAHQGAIVALDVCRELKKINTSKRDELAAGHNKVILRMKKLRVFLDTLYPPPEPCYHPADNTIICRCEEVTAGEIRSMAKNGCTGPNQTKAFSRCGMGPCQGRYCGNTVTEILAAAHHQSQDDIGYYRIRSPIKPVTLQELASLHSIG